MQDDNTLIALSDNAARAIDLLQRPDDFPEEAESSDDTPRLLRWLRNLPSIENSLEDWLETGTLAEQIGRADSLRQLIQSYARQFRKARKQNAASLADAAVAEATHAATTMAQGMMEMALRLLPPGHPQVVRLQAKIDALPEQLEMRQSRTVRRLVENVESGFNRLSGKTIDRSAADRLLEMSRRIEATARKLRSIDTLEQPAREESIELAREILRRLRDMSFSDKPLEEMIDAGRPEDKLALAQQIEEMADSYRNLLLEAAQDNAAILQDPAVKAASDAVGGFAHAVKLMAAKEMPNSIAAAQQISADAAQSPEEWKDLHHRTMNRLLASMEGGIEKAANQLAQQEEQAEEQGMDQQANDAALHSEGTRRKKKKRRRSSGFGAKKQRKAQLDLTADDYILKQGRFAEESKTIRAEVPLVRPDTAIKAQNDMKTAQEMAFMRGLTPEALAAIQKAGDSLKQAGQQLKNIGGSVANVSATDKITPDDKTISQRVIETELQKAQRLGQTGPGV